MVGKFKVWSNCEGVSMDININSVHTYLVRYITLQIEEIEIDGASENRVGKTNSSTTSK